MDRAWVERLFEDLAGHAEVESIATKAGPGAQAGAAAATLDDARRRLLDGGVRGLQIRYRWQGQAWIDTLLAAPGGWRVVRIAAAGPAS